MYTGGNESSETSPSNGPSSETRRVPSQQPGHDQPVGAIKPNYLTDDNLKVTTKINNLSLGS